MQRYGHSRCNRGKIYSTTSGTEVATGEARYSVVIKDGNCYLVDDMGNPAVAESGSSVSIGDRVYRGFRNLEITTTSMFLNTMSAPDKSTHRNMTAAEIKSGGVKQPCLNVWITEWNGLTGITPI